MLELIDINKKIIIIRTASLTTSQETIVLEPTIYNKERDALLIHDWMKYKSKKKDSKRILYLKPLAGNYLTSVLKTLSVNSTHFSQKQ